MRKRGLRNRGRSDVADPCYYFSLIRTRGATGAQLPVALRIDRRSCARIGSAGPGLYRQLSGRLAGRTCRGPAPASQQPRPPGTRQFGATVSTFRSSACKSHATDYFARCAYRSMQAWTRNIREHRREYHRPDRNTSPAWWSRHGSSRLRQSTPRSRRPGAEALHQEARAQMRADRFKRFPTGHAITRSTSSTASSSVP